MRTGLVVASSLLVGLASCAQPRSGPNIAAVRMQAAPDVPLKDRPSIGQELHAVVNDEVNVPFPNGSARLTDVANDQLDIAARLFRDANPVEMYVAGHADNVGAEYPNLLLSAQRAEAVKVGLAARGIPADRLLIEAYGQARPLNAENGAAAVNRCTVITWRLL